MDFTDTLSLVRRLREALAAELERARAERGLLGKLNAAALLGCANDRSAFVAKAAPLERQLAARLEAARASLGLDAFSLAGLRARAGAAGDALAQELEALRALSRALHAEDAVNLSVARRVLACVRGHLDALRPSARAYDRRGMRYQSAQLATTSSKG